MSKNFFYYAIVCFALSWDAAEAKTCTFHTKDFPKDAELRLVITDDAGNGPEINLKENQTETRECYVHTAFIDWMNGPGKFGKADCDYQPYEEHRDYYINYLGKSNDGKYKFDCKAPGGKTKK